MRRPSVLSCCLIVATMAVTAGCSTGGDDDAATTTTAAATTSSEATSTTEAASSEGEEDDGDDICPSTAELETVVGGPVEVDGNSGASMSASLEGSISYVYSGCEAELTEGGQGTVSITRIDSAQIDGVEVEGSVFTQLRDAAVADFAEDGFEQLAELGAEAYRDGSQVVFLSGDVVVFVEVDVDGEASVDAALEVAAALISSDETIPSDDLDCEVLGAMVSESFGDVTDTAVSGGSMIIGDLQFETTGCQADHSEGNETSIDVTDASVWQEWIAAKESSTFTSSLTEPEVGEHDAFDDGERLVVDDGDRPWVIEASGDDLDPDPAAVRLSLAELAVGR